MGKVVSLAEEKEFRTPHQTGQASCMLCKHKWVAVAPVGVVWLECPECHSEKGHYDFECIKEEQHWQCGCGNELFYITRDGAYCPNCGVRCKF